MRSVSAPDSLASAHARSSLIVDGIGVSVRLRLGGTRRDELADALASTWSRCLRESGQVGDPPELSIELNDPAAQSPESVGRDGVVLASADRELLLSRSTQAITTALIQQQIGRLLMLHAGALAHPRTGRSVVFVAESGAGKTTLARSLGRRWAYVTDETVAIDAADRILPYPKPLSVRVGDWLVKEERSPDDLGLVPLRVEPFVTRVLILDRVPGHVGHPVVTALDPFDAIAELAPQTSSLHALERGLHRCATLLDRTGPALRLRYDEASSLEPVLDDLIGAP